MLNTIAIRLSTEREGRVASRPSTLQSALTSLAQLMYDPPPSPNWIHPASAPEAGFPLDAPTEERIP
jgi:hypothetical protein